MSILTNLTPDEDRIVSLYSNPRVSYLRGAIRLSIQYAGSAGIFLILAIVYHRPWYALVTYIIFLAFFFIRLRRGIKVGRVMRGLIRKYEERIAELEQKAAADA
jgi:hypothetical protein